MEARRILDPAIAAESAMRATSSDLTRMLRVLTSTEKRLGDPNLRAQADFDFHLALAEATAQFCFRQHNQMTLI